MIGFRDGRSLLHRAHPYTPLAVATALLCLVFAARSPSAVAMLAGVAIVLALAGGSLRYVARPALMLALPTWVLLLVLHGLLGPAPHHLVGPFSVSTPGLTRALVFGGRITAILFAFLSVLATVSPARLVEAMTERGVPFGTMYLLVSTLTLVPRLRARAAQILEAQQCRGLRLRGSPVARVRALGPLVLPLVLGALMEVDEQVLALDTRGASSSSTRTALDPPDDTTAEWVLRLLCVIWVFAAWSARLLEALEPLRARLVSLL
ncbi:MAG: energy-coupling factor transporter transmembrane component T family protein [Gemmatimonadales bacterium]